MSPRIINLFNLRVDVEVWWDLCDLNSNLLKSLFGKSCSLDLSEFRNGDYPVIVLCLPFSHVKSLAQWFVIGLFEDFHLTTPHVFNLFLWNYSLFHKLLSVKLVNVLSFTDNLIHHGLSEGRLILLVMSVSPVPYNVNKDILMELLSVLDSYVHGFMDKLWLVSIYVNDWGLNWFGNVSAIKSSPGLGWSSCETNLVIGYDMNNTVRLIMR